MSKELNIAECFILVEKADVRTKLYLLHYNINDVSLIHTSSHSCCTKVSNLAEIKTRLGRKYVIGTSKPWLSVL